MTDPELDNEVARLMATIFDGKPFASPTKRMQVWRELRATLKRLTEPPAGMMAIAEIDPRLTKL